MTTNMTLSMSPTEERPKKTASLSDRHRIAVVVTVPCMEYQTRDHGISIASVAAVSLRTEQLEKGSWRNL